jgi:hypothetical protein
LSIIWGMGVIYPMCDCRFGSVRHDDGEPDAFGYLALAQVVAKCHVTEKRYVGICGRLGNCHRVLPEAHQFWSLCVGK